MPHQAGPETLLRNMLPLLGQARVGLWYRGGGRVAKCLLGDFSTSQAEQLDAFAQALLACNPLAAGDVIEPDAFPSFLESLELAADLPASASSSYCWLGRDAHESWGPVLLMIDASLNDAAVRAFFDAYAARLSAGTDENAVLKALGEDRGIFYAFDQNGEAVFRSQRHRMMFGDHGNTRLSGQFQMPGMAALPTSVFDQVRSQGQWQGEVGVTSTVLGEDSVLVRLSRYEVRERQSSEYLAVIEPRQQAQKISEELHRLAFTDTLTGLANRARLMSQLVEQLAGARMLRTIGALLVIDIDRFKEINDTFGHSVGDDVLRGLAKRLEAHCGRQSTLARLSGDEFVLIIPHLGDTRKQVEKRGKERAEVLINAIEEPIHVDALRLELSASVGVCLFPRGLESAEQLLRDADIAMIEAKHHRANKVAIYCGEMMQAVQRRYEVEHSLREAIEADQLALWLQPQVNTHGKLVGAEALVRWIHPEKGLVPPCDFVPIAERSSLIVLLGNWVVREAARLARKMASLPGSPALSVNISARQFFDPRFVDALLNAIQESGVPAQQLTLELTENLMIEDINSVVAKMNLLAEFGFGFSVDDFGTGYSSLRYLNRMPLEELKLDREFVDRLPESREASFLVHTILDLAKNLELRVVAEGVETQAQRRYLEEQGCEVFQGYLIDRPLPEEEFFQRWCAQGTQAHAGQ
jgi:diguanylate cyclase (GGDEF)-like protein